MAVPSLHTRSGVKGLVSTAAEATADAEVEGAGESGSARVEDTGVGVGAGGGDWQAPRAMETRAPSAALVLQIRRATMAPNGTAKPPRGTDFPVAGDAL